MIRFWFAVPAETGFPLLLPALRHCWRCTNFAHRWLAEPPPHTQCRERTFAGLPRIMLMSLTLVFVLSFSATAQPQAEKQGQYSTLASVMLRKLPAYQTTIKRLDPKPFEEKRAIFHSIAILVEVQVKVEERRLRNRFSDPKLAEIARGIGLCGLGAIAYDLGLTEPLRALDYACSLTIGYLRNMVGAGPVNTLINSGYSQIIADRASVPKATLEPIYKSMSVDIHHLAGLVNDGINHQIVQRPSL